MVGTSQNAAGAGPASGAGGSAATAAARPQARHASRIEALTFAILLLACGKHNGSALPGLVQVSNLSPYPAGCANAANVNNPINYANSEVEPRLAANPVDAQNLVAVWQQDRWSADGGAKGLMTAASFDSGHSWSKVAVPFTVCAGGGYERASDPWVTFAADGTAWQIALAFDESRVNRAILVASSTDGGRSWSAPSTLEHDTDPDLAVDKESISGDPADASHVYAVWDRVDHFTQQNSPLAHGPALFSRTVDGGRNWSQPVSIHDPGADAQTIGNQIVVLPGGGLVDGMMILTHNSTPNPVATVAVLLSADQGVSWSQPVNVAPAALIGIPSKTSGAGIRTGNVVPDIAVDASTGALSMVWQDAISGAAAIVLSRSTDGGLTWSAPAKVNQSSADAFTPVVSSAGGRVAVTFTDLRNDDPTDRAHLLATQWMAVSSDGGAHWTETQMTPPFDLQNAPLVADGYFLGDYQGLAHAGGSFLALFSAVNGENRGDPTEIFFRPADAPAVAASPLYAARQSLSTARLRWRSSTLFK